MMTILSKVKPTTVNIGPTVMKMVISAGQAATTHNYYGKIGENTFELTTIDSSISGATKIVAVFNILATPSKWFDIFRIRAKNTVNINGTIMSSEWSDPSFWVLIIDLKKLGMPTGVK